MSGPSVRSRVPTTTAGPVQVRNLRTGSCVDVISGTGRVARSRCGDGLARRWWRWDAACPPSTGKG